MFTRGGIANARVLVLCAALAVSFLLFLLIDLASFNQNDFMYGAAAAVWAQNGALYTDVPFVQAPLSLLMNALLIRMTGDPNIFLIGRLLSMALVALAVMLPLLVKSIDPGERKGTIFVIYIGLCLTNPQLASNSREIGNYAIALLGLSASLTLIHTRGPAWGRGFAASVAIGLAVSAKLYFAVICPGLLLYFLAIDKDARALKVIAACGIGLALGCAPILYFLISDYKSFWTWNVAIHELILKVREVGPFDSLKLMVTATTDFLPLMSIPLGFVLVSVAEAYRRGGTELREEAAKLALLAFAYAMALSPVVVFIQYLGPLAFLLFVFALPRRWTNPVLRSAFMIFSGTLLCIQWALAAQTLGYLVRKDDGLAVAQVLAVQRSAKQVVMNGYRCERRLFSGEPLFLLAKGVKYPAELAAGPFLLFLRGHVLAGSKQEFDADVLIRRWSPDVVIWGYYLDSPIPREDAVDRTVRSYALDHAFTVVTLGRVDGHTIYLGYRRDCKAAPAS